MPLKIIFSSADGIKKLKYPPKNADALKFMLSRDKTYKGIGRKVTDSFEFVKDGREYLKNLFYSEGIDANLSIEIYLVNQSGWNKSQWLGTYKGDFSEFKITDTVATIKLIDSEFESRLTSRQSTEVNLNTLTSIDGDVLPGDLLPIKQMSLHDRTIKLENEHEMTADQYDPIAFNYSDRIYWPIGLVSNYKSYEKINENIAVFYDYQQMVANAYIPESIYLSNNDKDVVLNFDVKIPFQFLGKVFNFNGPVSIYFRVVRIDQNLQTTDILYTNALYTGNAPLVDTTVFFEQTFSVNVLKDDSIGIEILIDGVQCYFSIDVEQAAIFGNYVRTYTTDFYQATTPNVMLPHESGERLLQLITGSQTPLYSPIFGRTEIGYPTTGEWAYLGMFNGFMVRGFDYATKPINISFKTWFEDYSSILNLAAYVDRTQGYARLVVDKLERILDASKVGIKIDNYQDLQVEPMGEEYFATLQFGYENVEHEQVVGLDPFNGTLNFATPVGNTSNVLKKQGKTIADDYAIALAQRKPFKSFSQEDTRYDEKNMFIDCGIGDAGIYSKRTEDFESVEGIQNPAQAYNLNISPMRNLLRHSRSLMVGLYRKTDKKLKFVKGAKNDKLVTKRNDEAFTVYENQDNDISTLGVPFLLPYFITFKAKIKLDDFLFVNENPNHLVEMTVAKVKIYGFIDEFEYNIATSEAEFKLMQSNR